jgi:hypothetical protein
VDRGRELFMVLLTGSTDPARQDGRIEEARTAIFESVVRAVTEAPAKK